MENEEIASNHVARDLIQFVIDDEYFLKKTTKSMTAKVNISLYNSLINYYSHYSNISISKAKFCLNNSGIVDCVLIRWIIK